MTPWAIEYYNCRTKPKVQETTIAYDAASKAGFEAEERRSMTHKIVLHQSGEGYSVWIPGLLFARRDGGRGDRQIKVAVQEYLSTVETLIEGGEVLEA